MFRTLPQSTAARAITALLCAGVALFSFRYLVTGVAEASNVLANSFADPFLILHVLGAATALLVSPFQFVARFRSLRSGLHRMVGRIYVGSCLVGGTSGLVLAAGSTAGPVATGGFGLLALAWLSTTSLGWRRAMQGRIAEHRRWMIRSWALTMAAVTLRLYLPLLPALGVEFFAGYRAISWLCWVPNLLFAEAWLRYVERPQAAPGPLP